MSACTLSACVVLFTCARRSKLIFALAHSMRRLEEVVAPVTARCMKMVDMVVNDEAMRHRQVRMLAGANAGASDVCGVRAVPQLPCCHPLLSGSTCPDSGKRNLDFQCQPSHEGEVSDRQLHRSWTCDGGSACGKLSSLVPAIEYLRCYAAKYLCC